MTETTGVTFGDYAEKVDGPELLELPSERIIREYEPLQALVHPAPRSLGITIETAKLITHVLDSGGIEYFAVPGFAPFATTLAVNASDKARVVSALQEISGRADRPARVSQVVPPPATYDELTTSTQGLVARLSNAHVIRVWWDITDPGHSVFFGGNHGVEIEFWAVDVWREGVHSFTSLTDEDRRRRLVAPRPNRAARVIDSASEIVRVDGARFAAIASERANTAFTVPTRSELNQHLPDEVRFPIDVVYTWVDGSDRRWADERAKYSGEPTHAEASGVARFISRDELRYSLRSLFANAPWVNRVFIVTDGQRPSWLKPGYGIEVVDHKEIFSDPSVLPVYNSHAIEANLHRIPGLSEHFLYFNDDMFLGRPVSPKSFFFSNGLAKFFASQSRVPFTPKSVNDSPVDAATKNVRRLMEETFGVTVSQVMEHAPYPLRRSVLEEMESRFADAFSRTSRSRFRSPDDLNVPSNFAHHYAFQTGRAIASTLPFTYVGLSVRDLQVRLNRLLERRDVDAFCLNDTFSTGDDLEAQLDVVVPFLDAYFPVVAPWEGI